MSFPADFNPYKILQLSSNSSSSIAAIKKAYRKLAIKFHPDKVESKDVKKATQKFHQIQKAYDFLMDANLKVDYDKKFAAKAKRQEAEARKKNHRSKSRQNLIDELEKHEIGKFEISNHDLKDAEILAKRLRELNREAVDRHNFAYVYEALRLSKFSAKQIPTFYSSFASKMESFNLEAAEDEILKGLL